MRNRKMISVFLAIALAGLIGIFAVAVIFGNHPFNYSVNHVITISGRAVDINEFIGEDEDMSDVTVAFAYPGRIDFSTPGRHDVELMLTRGNNSLNTMTGMYVLGVVDYLQFELADANSVTPEPIDFLTNAHAVSLPVAPIFLEEIPDISTLEVGEHPIYISVDGVDFSSKIIIADTTPPTVKLAIPTIAMGEAISVEDFIENVYDASPIAYIGFVEEPYVFASGPQTVEIALEDIFGNRAVYEATFNVLSNDIPPTITGVRNLEVVRGSAVMFRQGVSAQDAFGRTIEFTVDSSNVNTNVNGRYTVVYAAEDAQGLRTEVSAFVYVINVDPAVVHERVDAILATILREDMTQLEETRAIFTWVIRNVNYAADIGRESVYEGAMQALNHRRGNCFIFYSISEVMLTRAGIPNMRIDRIPGTPTRHRWNLVNPDDMGWHHFDTVPTRARIDRFMFTNSQAVEFTAIMLRYTGMANFYTFDPTLYPEIVY